MDLTKTEIDAAFERLRRQARRAAARKVYVVIGQHGLCPEEYQTWNVAVFTSRGRAEDRRVACDNAAAAVSRRVRRLFEKSIHGRISTPRNLADRNMPEGVRQSLGDVATYRIEELDFFLG